MRIYHIHTSLNIQNKNYYLKKVQKYLHLKTHPFLLRCLCHSYIVTGIGLNPKAPSPLSIWGAQQHWARRVVNVQALCWVGPLTHTYPSGLTVRFLLGSSAQLISFRFFLVCLTLGLLLCLLLLILSCSTPLSEDDSEEEEELEEESESSECVGFFLFFSKTFNRH